MVITIYTINECPFCKSEKEYLASHNLSFVEKNLETNREYLEEMMVVSDKFAGVPFTVINRDDGSVVKLKGFTKEEFDQALEFGQPAVIKEEAPDLGLPPLTPKEPVKLAEPVSPPGSEPIPPAPPPSSVPEPTPEPLPEPPKSEPPAPAGQSPLGGVSSPMPSQEALNKVLSSLEDLSKKTESHMPANPVVAQAAGASPNPGPLPQIPDFK